MEEKEYTMKKNDNGKLAARRKRKTCPCQKTNKKVKKNKSY